MKKIKSFLKRLINKNSFLYIAYHNLNHSRIYCFNKISGYSLEKKRFFKKLGYRLNLKNPQSFNEKIVWKKIYDRNPLIPLTSDKYQVRFYIKDMLGEKKAKEILIPLLYVTDKPESIPFDRISTPFIIKSNHASGQYIIIKNNDYNKREIIKTCQRWLKIPYGLDELVWGYQSIRRKIVIEKLLQEEDEKIPKDFKFHMFHGECSFIEVYFERIVRSGKYLNSYYNSQWNRLYNINPIYGPGPDIGIPNNFESMLMFAKKLSAFFDYVRVDLYNIDGKIFFGELTHYPSSGTRKFNPNSLDFELGKKWILKPDYWK